MMRKSLYGVLVLAALVACNKEVGVKKEAKSPITFDNSFVEIKTRAVITTDNIDKFDVWAYMDDTEAVVLDNERVTKNPDNTWSYENLQYWTANHTYYFGAVAPVDHSNIEVDTSNATEYGLGKISITNDGTDDLIYASKSVKTGSDVVYNAPEKVHLQFAHLLSRVKFTFTNGFPNQNTKVVVKDITMKAPKKASIDLSAGDWWSTNKWVVSEEGALLDFGDANGAAKIEKGGSAVSDTECFNIPNSGDRVHEIKFTVVLYHGTYETPAYTEEITVPLTGQEFKIGKSYNFAATISGDSLGLYPIEFTVAVNSWDPEISNGLEL